NYSLSADAGDMDAARAWRPRLTGLTGAFEARAFGGFGMIESGLVATSASGRATSVRLDSRWTYADADRAPAWRAGDVIAGGLSWTRPIRLGGVQFRRDFATRPDLVTMPTPILSATAAAPSMLEVALGSSVLLSRAVPAGPVQVNDLPVQGQGEARLVLRNAFGMEQVVSASYFATPELLRAGLVDFSFEGGFARRSFGVRSADYDDRPLVSATGRYGVSDTLTLQGHMEAGAGLANVGGGVVGRMGSRGLVSVAAAVSHHDDGPGGLINVVFESRVGRYALAGQAQRTFGAYRDLAAVTASRRWLGDSINPPRGLIQMSASAPLPIAAFERWGDLPAIAASYALLDEASGPRRDLYSASVRFGFHGGVSLQAAAYASHTPRRDSGVFLALSAPLGGARTTTVGLDRAGGRSSAFAEVRDQETIEPGAVGWRLRADHGRRSGAMAEGVYRGGATRLAGRIAHYDGSSEASVRAEGAVVWLGGPLVIGERIDGAFAAVDVGAPGVLVTYQNRPIARTGRSGRILAPNLDAYGANLLAIEASDLPLSILAPVTRLTVSPPYGAGVRAAFNVTPAPRQVVLRLRVLDGAPPPPGAMASLDGGPFDRVVGYDGELFLEDATAATHVRIDLGAGEVCAATIPSNHSEAPHGATLDCR
ncbi:MAG: fimbria/pilus outer membrane usher protein, partial [Phenylobacterium sp.]|nr:fimbria/pilus outer membrane usher protein [Phenylobacterium sp.]